MLKRTVEETREQLQEETTARKVAGQKAGSLESQLHESRKERVMIIGIMLNLENLRVYHFRKVHVFGPFNSQVVFFIKI